MNSIIDNMEAILIEAHKVKGWQFVHEEALWVTWTLEKFGMGFFLLFRSPLTLKQVTSVASILVPYHRSLMLHTDLVNTLRSHSVSFEDSRIAISKWVAQPWLEDSSWDAQWEDICSVEVERWDK